MADRLLHFSVGLALGMAVMLWPVIRAWKTGARLAGPLGRAILLSYILGMWAVVPNVLRHLGCPADFCAGWWMNIFVLHPVINAVHPGGMLIGALLALACFALQYGLLVAAIAWRKARP